MASQLRRLFDLYSPCVIGLEVTDEDGDVAMGTAFHIGDGFFVTARHVVEGQSITSVVGPGSRSIREIYSVRYPSDETVDLAILSTDSGMATAVPIGGHYDDWIGEHDFLLDPVLLMGFPRVPKSEAAILVAVSGEINAIVDRYDVPHVHFLISSVPRGGFSGGPVIHDGGADDGWLLGVLTAELSQNAGSGEHQEPLEAPFAAVLSIEPILVLLDELAIAPTQNRALCYLLNVDADTASAFTEVLSQEDFSILRQYRSDPSSMAEPLDLGTRTPPIVDGPALWRARRPS